MLVKGWFEGLPGGSRVRDQTGYAGPVDLAMRRGFSNLLSIRENLAENGLVLKKAERRVKAFVISER